MLMTMRAYTEGCRAMALVAAAAYDAADRHPDAEVRKQNAAFYEYMVPLVKGYSTEMSLDVASLGVQVHGGMGFVEETGAAQYLRDARITTIYEGTTGIQAMDLVGRKIAREGGETAKQWIAQLKQVETQLSKSNNENLVALRSQFAAGVQAVADCVEFILASSAKDPRPAFAGAVPFLKLMGIVAGGWQMGRAALA